MMDMFLRGFDGKAEEMKKQWEKNNMIVDVKDELEVLKKVYEEALQHLESQDQQKMENLMYYMKDFVKTHEEKGDIEKKLKTLLQKMNPQQCDDCDCDEDEDE